MIKDLCFEIIEKCPNNCLFCSSESNMQKSRIIDFQTFKKTVDYFMSQGGIEEISLSGGEPMLHPDIYKMVEYCSGLGIKTTLYTSGVVERKIELTSPDKHIQKMINKNGDFCDISKGEFERLKNCGLSKVVFDMQATDQDVYGHIMGSRANLPWLLKSLLHASYFDFEKSIHLIPTKINAGQIKEILEIAEMAGVSEIRVLKFVPQGRGRANKQVLQLDDESLARFVDYAKKLKSKTVKIKIGIPLQENNQHICTAGFDKISIRYDGEILPCPAFKDIDLNLLKQKGYEPVNIFKNLEDFIVKDKAHVVPLCQQFKRHSEEEKTL